MFVKPNYDFDRIVGAGTKGIRTYNPQISQIIADLKCNG